MSKFIYNSDDKEIHVHLPAVTSIGDSVKIECGDALKVTLSREYKPYEWIKCSNILPDEENGYLCFKRHNDDLISIRIDHYIPGEGWSDVIDYTHWMPLPNVPED